MPISLVRLQASLPALAFFVILQLIPFFFAPPVSGARVPSVSVAATDSSASENAADKGVFQIRKSSVTTAPLTVYFKISGTADAADYVSLPQSVTIPAAATSVSIDVLPIDDALVESDETVILTILSSSAYKTATPASATVMITDNDTEPQLPANELYVSSTRGSDANAGRSAQTPLRTINAALTQASPGTTVYIEGGTYFEHIVTRFAGLPGQEITLTSYNGTAVVDGSTLSWTAGGNQNQGLIELRHAFVRLDGLRVVNSRNTGIVLDADNLTIENCVVGETQRHGISTDTKRQTNYPGMPGTMIRNIAIKNNTVYRTVLKGSGFGQAVSLIADGFVVSGNTVRDNPMEGIDIWLGARHGEVVDNTVYGNARPGIYVDGASYVRIHRNRIYNNLKGIGVTSEDVNYSTSHIWVFNNLVYDNTDAGLFIWDDASKPGHRGSQNVLLANNTLVNNKLAVYLAGDGNTAEILNNTGYSTGSSVYNSSTNSSYSIRNNAWLSSLAGFVDAAGKNFRLTAASPAVNAGAPLPILFDDLGNVFPVETDFDKLARTNGTTADAGAHELAAN